MQRKAKESCGDAKPMAAAVEDSPTIQNLIEQLNRDLEETQRNNSRSK
jgi:hypothetical protein